MNLAQDGLCVTGIAQYYNCHPSTIQDLRDRGYWDSKRLSLMWLTKKCNTPYRRYIDGVFRQVALSSLRQNQRKANFIDRHDNATAHTARLTVNFQAANITLVLARLPLSLDMPAIELLIATLKSKGITI